VESDAARSVASDAPLAKICALGVRIRRGASLHGIALNVTTDLSLFNLINPCGLGRPVTRLRDVLGDRAPDMAAVKAALARQMGRRFP
jgi:lipoyl(octanoyl) transferase